MVTILLSLILTNPAPDVDFAKGSYLFRNCQATVRLRQGTQFIKDGDLTRSQYCAGYIDGFTDGLSLFEPEVCVGEANLATLANVYVAYVENHPKMLGVEKRVSLLTALADAYPCSKRQN